MTISLKIEIVKIFKLEFSLSSDREIKPKKDKQDEKESATAAPADKQSRAS